MTDWDILVPAYDAARRRAELSEQHHRQLESLLLDLVAVLDSLDRIDPPEGSAPDLVRRQLEQALRRQGVEAVPALGERFDPRCHEAAGCVPPGEAPPGTVARELARGYLWNGAPLRPARVLVAGQPAPPEGETGS
jgi:molecular chaperone GrpE